MDDESSVPPVQPIGSERVDPVARWNRRKRYARGEDEARELRARVDPVPSDPGGDRRELLDDELELDQLEGGEREPREVEVDAAVHDSAVHGNPIAQAIERARHSRDGDDRSPDRPAGP